MIMQNIQLHIFVRFLSFVFLTTTIILICHNHYINVDQTKLHRPTQFSTDNIRPAFSHLAVVSCNGRTDETITLIKSALIFSNCSRLQFHIFLDHHSYSSVIKSIAQFERECNSSSIIFSIYNATYPVEFDWMRNKFAACSSFRLLLPQLLNNIDAVIYVDSDAIFLADPALLWQYFAKFNRTQLIATAQMSESKEKNYYKDHSRIPYVKPAGVQAGVILMNLTRMRDDFNWTSYIKPIAHKYRNKLLLFDQDIINIIMSNHTDRYYHLTCDWNYRKRCCETRRQQPDTACQSAIIGGAKLVHALEHGFDENANKSIFSNIYQILKLYRYQQSICTHLLPQIRMSFENRLLKSARCYEQRFELIRHMENNCLVKNNISLIDKN